MRVKDIMTTHVASCNPATNLATAVEMLWSHDCGALPVLDDVGRVIGIVTDRDLCIALGTRDRRPSELTVGDVMQPALMKCEPGADIRSALDTMGAEKIRRLLVVDATETLKGILCMNDVILHSRRSGNGLSYEQVMDTLKAISTHPGAAQVENSLAVLETQRALVASP